MNARAPLAALRAAGQAAVRSATGLYRTWPLAGFSLVAAFGVWIVVQDVENPRERGLAPAGDQPAIRVEAVNVPDGLIVGEPSTVRVRVEARKRDLPDLRDADFRATVDLSGVEAGTRVSRAVRVESRHDGVRVIGVEPGTVDVALVRADTRELPVQVRRTGELSSNLVVQDEPVVDPPFIRIQGLPQLVASVKSVELEVNLSGAREGSVAFEGDVIARTESGNPVALNLSQRRARATFKVEQAIVQRTVPLLPVVSGAPAPGYIVANIAIDPPTVLITGPRSVVDSIRTLSLERLDVTAALRNVTQSRQVDRPPNVSVDRQTVVVRVDIRAIECGPTGSAAPCGSAAFTVAPVFENVPIGLAVEPGVSHVAVVRVSGQLSQLALLRASDIRASVSFVLASAGTSTFNVNATLLPSAPSGLRIEATDPIAIRLVSVGGAP